MARFVLWGGRVEKGWCSHPRGVQGCPEIVHLTTSRSRLNVANWSFVFCSALHRVWKMHNETNAKCLNLGTLQLRGLVIVPWSLVIMSLSLGGATRTCTWNGPRTRPPVSMLIHMEDVRCQCSNGEAGRTPLSSQLLLLGGWMPCPRILASRIFQVSQVRAYDGILGLAAGFAA